MVIKGQVLADLVVEFIGFPEEVPIAPIGKHWQVHIDGLSCQTSGGVGVHIITGAGKEHNYTIKLAFKTTNNETENEALLVRLLIALLLGANEVDFRVDSQVVVNQVMAGFSMKGEKLRKYMQLVKEECDFFQYFRIQQVQREDNQRVDQLAQAAPRQENSRLLEGMVT